jgi:polysaccharide pyruvyl transferase WcaK-like protein
VGNRPRIAIIGGSIWGNRGAEAMIVTAIGQIRQRWPEAEFEIFSYLPHRDRQLLSDPRVKVTDARPVALVFVLLPFALVCWAAGLLGLRPRDSMLPRAIRRLRQADVMIDVFGISFADGREVFLPFNVVSLIPAMLLGVPVVKLSQAMGPFRHRINRLASRIMLSRCEHIFARGDATAGFLEELGIPPSRWSVASDIAFLFEAKYSLTQEGVAKAQELGAELSTHVTQGRKVVAICPSSVVLKKAESRGMDYLGLLEQVIRDALQHNRAVLVLPHATREGTDTLRNNDLPVIGRLRCQCEGRLLQSERRNLHWVDFDIGSGGIRGLMASADVVVTSRFHAMVGALALGKRVLVLGWSHKYREVLRQFSVEDSCFEIESTIVEVGALVERVGKMLEPSFAADWPGAKHLPDVRRSCSRQFDRLESVIQQRLQARPHEALPSSRA